MKKVPIEVQKEWTDALADAHIRCQKFFKRNGEEYDFDHTSAFEFARVVEIEYKHGRQIGFPMARKMFMLGYMKGHRSEIERLTERNKLLEAVAEGARIFLNDFMCSDKCVPGALQRLLTQLGDNK